MDWQHVKAAPGQFIKLQVLITEISHQSGQYGPYALGKAKDGPGYIEQALFTVKKGAIFPSELAAGHLINCAGKFDANTSDMKVFFDSYAQNQSPPPNSYPPAATPAQQTPPPPPQQPPPPPQSTNVPPPTRDATGISIERQTCVKAVGEIFHGAGDKVNLGIVVKVLCALHKWVTDGQDIPTMGAEPADWADTSQPPAGDDDIPFDQGP